MLLVIVVVKSSRHSSKEWNLLIKKKKSKLLFKHQQFWYFCLYITYVCVSHFYGLEFCEVWVILRNGEFISSHPNCHLGGTFPKYLNFDRATGDCLSEVTLTCSGTVSLADFINSGHWRCETFLLEPLQFVCEIFDRPTLASNVAVLKFSQIQHMCCIVLSI